MKVSTYLSIRTILYLDRMEEFQAETMDNNKFGFFVTQITWDGSEWVSYRGPGRSRAGARLSVYRSDTWRSFNKLPENLQNALRKSRHEAIEELMREEAVRILGPLKEQ